jgi:hypothetical protein
MANPISSSSTERIPLHSIVARPLVWIMTAIYVTGALGQSRSLLAGGEAGPRALVIAIALAGGLMLWKVWSLCQRVYMTPEGIELTRPPRVVPWSRVGDAFRIPLTGSVTPICCIGIHDAENWDLHFLGRADFDQVIGARRAKPPVHS